MPAIDKADVAAANASASGAKRAKVAKTAPTAPAKPITRLVAAEATIPESAPAPAPIIEEQTMDNVNTAETVVDTTTAKAQAMIGDMNARAKGAMEKGTQLFEDVNAFTKDNVEAIVESSKIAAKGVESMAQESAEYVRKSFEASTAVAKTLAQTKSPTEFLKLQGDYARQSFDMMVAQTSRSTEAMLKLAGEIAQPISNRLAVAAEKMKIAA